MGTVRFSGWLLCELRHLLEKTQWKNQEVTLVEEVIMHLMEPFLHQNRHVYFDRYFTSPSLMECLHQHDTYACGTVMPNRRGLPPAMKKAKLKERGECIQKQKAPLVATEWRDKRQIHMLSTSQDPGVDEDSGAPHLVSRYNKGMGGVDKSDQLRSYYPVGRKSKTWWRYIPNFIINLCLVQAYLTWENSSHVPQPKKSYNHLMFRSDVAEQLRAGFTSRKTQRRWQTCSRGFFSGNRGQHQPSSTGENRWPPKSVSAVLQDGEKNSQEPAGGNIIPLLLLQSAFVQVHVLSRVPRPKSGSELNLGIPACTCMCTPVHFLT